MPHHAYAARLRSFQFCFLAATRSLYCQESFYRSRESIASPIISPAPIRRDSPDWATRRLGEGRRTVGTRASSIVRGSRHQEADDEAPKRCARETAGGATAQVVPGRRLLQLSRLEGTLFSVL